MGNLLAYQEEEADPRIASDAARPAVTSNRPAIESMATSVKGVLPQVPLDVIRKDLTITANVDETIARLLDGTVTYVPEKKQPPKTIVGASAPASQPALPPPHAPLITAAATFGKTADERHRSFEERKQRLIEESRRRYLAKQAIPVGDSST